MKKLFLSMMLLALPILASAYDCQVDGIYYELRSENQAEVTYESTNYNSYSGEVVIPEKFTYNGVEYSVTSIGNRAFSKCSGLTSVTIPNSVIKIGNNAFYNCSGLTSVTIPNSVTSIGSNAFSGCSALTSVHITDLEAWCKIVFNYSDSNPLSYAHHLYLNGEEIRKLEIPNTVNSITNYAFCGCIELVSVTIPNSITSIGNSAFSNCSGLTSVTMVTEVRPLQPVKVSFSMEVTELGRVTEVRPLQL